MIILLLAVLSQSEQRSESGLRYHLVGAGGGKKPMIIFLHGTYGNAAYWGGYVTAAKDKGFIAVLPYSTGDGSDDGKSGDGIPRWGKIDIPKVVSLAREMQKKYGADPRRTHIAGFSNGGWYAFEIGLRHPEVFASILCMGGGNAVWKFEDRMKHLGIYVVHGTKDQSCGFDSGKGAADKCRAEGFKDVVFKEKTGKGHEIFMDEIGPYLDWVSKQKRPTRPGANASIQWSTDPKALEGEGKVLVYLYSPKDESSDFVDWLETDALLSEAVVKEAAEFTCVKINRDEAKLPEWLASKQPALAVVEKGKVLFKFVSISSAKTMGERLKGLKKK